MYAKRQIIGDYILKQMVAKCIYFFINYSKLNCTIKYEIYIIRITFIRNRYFINDLFKDELSKLLLNFVSFYEQCCRSIY